MKKRGIIIGIAAIATAVCISGCFGGAGNPGAGFSEAEAEAERGRDYGPAEIREVSLSEKYENYIGAPLAGLKDEYPDIRSARYTHDQISGKGYMAPEDENLVYLYRYGYGRFSAIPDAYLNDFSRIGNFHVWGLLGEVGVLFPDVNREIAFADFVEMLGVDDASIITRTGDKRSFEFDFKGYSGVIFAVTESVMISPNMMVWLRANTFPESLRRFEEDRVIELWMEYDPVGTAEYLRIMENWRRDPDGDSADERISLIDDLSIWYRNEGDDVPHDEDFDEDYDEDFDEDYDEDYDEDFDEPGDKDDEAFSPAPRSHDYRVKASSAGLTLTLTLDIAGEKKEYYAQIKGEEEREIISILERHEIASWDGFDIDGTSSIRFSGTFKNGMGDTIFLRMYASEEVKPYGFDAFFTEIDTYFKSILGW